jgi:hypothetical protein
MGQDHDQTSTSRPPEDDVTAPGSAPDVPEGDRAEQQALVDPPEVTTAGEAQPPPADVPEADALEQQLAARPQGTGGALSSVGDREADEADVLEQEVDVPLEDDEQG